jgi:hypothetical protein
MVGRRGISAMLQLFQSIFGSKNEPSPHSVELISRAIERTVDGTDPRLRALSGYQKKLRPAVIHAIDHVVALVDGLPPVLDLSARAYGSDPETTAYFASVDHLHEVLERDAIFSQWRNSAEGTAAEQVVVLLLMTLEERRVLGVGLEGDSVRHDVAQTTVSFSKHRWVDPARVEAETRRLLKRRAFDHLLSLALAGIGTAIAGRGDLERERDLVRRKQAALAAGRWGFEETSGAQPPDPQALQSQLEEIESQLQALGAGPALLDANLIRVIDVLKQAERTLWAEQASLIVDRLGFKQTQASAQAPGLRLTVLRNANGEALVARVIRIARDALPQRRDLLHEAERYLR